MFNKYTAGGPAVHSLHSGAFLRAAARPRDYPKCRYKALAGRPFQFIRFAGCFRPWEPEPAPSLASLHRIEFYRSGWQPSLKRWRLLMDRESGIDQLSLLPPPLVNFEIHHPHRFREFCCASRGVTLRDTTLRGWNDRHWPLLSFQSLLPVKTDRLVARFISRK